jgi:hypothetical protein
MMISRRSKRSESKPSGKAITNPPRVPLAIHEDRNLSGVEASLLRKD